MILSFQMRCQSILMAGIGFTQISTTAHEKVAELFGHVFVH
jgi:hypothetical protein